MNHFDPNIVRMWAEALDLGSRKYVHVRRDPVHQGTNGGTLAITPARACSACDDWGCRACGAPED